MHPRCPHFPMSLTHLLKSKTSPCPLNAVLAAQTQESYTVYFGEQGAVWVCPTGKTIRSYCLRVPFSTFRRGQRDITSLVGALTSASCVTPLRESSHNSGYPVTEKKPFLPEEVGSTRLTDRLTSFRNLQPGSRPRPSLPDRGP